MPEHSSTQESSEDLQSTPPLSTRIPQNGQGTVEEPSGEAFVPYIKAEQKIPEMTIVVIILGIMQALVFGIADAYLGLKIGMTVGASIPAAVISMGVLKGILKRGTILENNLIQNMASVGESLAAGVIFTVPALFILANFLQTTGQSQILTPDIFQIFFVASLGGILGILLMIPLRRYLIVQEHGKLRYPEGTACAEVLIAGDEGGAPAKTVFSAIAVAGLYRFLMNGLRLFKETPIWGVPALGTALSFDMLPSLLAVGFIIGVRTAGIMLAGSLLGWFVIIPLIHFQGAWIHVIVPPGKIPLSDIKDPMMIWSSYLRYIGAGAVAFGGLVSLVRSLPTIVTSFSVSMKELLAKAEAKIQKIRTSEDIPFTAVLGGTALILLIMGVTRAFNPSGFLGGGLAVLFAFFFVTVAARIVGIVGSTSMPLSGMTIGALIAITAILKWFGWSGPAGIAAALVVGSVVCIAISMSGDLSQDLKIGFLVGATPKWVQITQMIGVLVAASVIGFTVKLFAPQVVNGTMVAPQANLMFLLSKGLMEGGLPWILVFSGMGVALTVEILGIPSLPFAVGLYLPLELNTTIMAGGLLGWFLLKRLPEGDRKAANDKGLLVASGLVAGDAIVGVILAMLLASNIDLGGMLWGKATHWFQDSNWITTGVFGVIAWYLWFCTSRFKRPS